MEIKIPTNDALESACTASTREPHSRGARQLLVFAVLTIMVVGGLMPVWISDYFPAQDRPRYLLSIQMFKEYQNPQWNYAEFYVRNWHPIPHMLHDLLVYTFSFAVPLLLAEKLALSLYVILLPASIFYLLSAVAPAQKSLGYLSFLMVHNWAFYRGYQHYVISIPLFFFAFGYWYGHRSRLSTRHVILLGVLAVAVYFSHLFTFLLLGLVVAGYRLIETRDLWKTAGAMLVVTWPAWPFYVDYLLLTARSSEWLDQSDTSWLPLHTATEYFVRKFFYSVSPIAYVVGVLGWLWVVYFIGRTVWRTGRSATRGQGHSIDGRFVLLVAGLIVGYFIVPYNFHGWHFVDLRLIPFILGLVLCCPMAGAISQRVRVAFIATVCVCSLTVNGLLAARVMEMSDLLKEYLSGVDVFEPNSRLLPVLAESPQFGQVDPLTRAYEYYHIAKGGANGLGVGNFNTLTMVWYRKYPVETVFPRLDRSAIAKSMKEVERVYDYVLLWGEDNELVDCLESSKFRIVHHQGRLRLYQNVPTSMRPSE